MIDIGFKEMTEVSFLWEEFVISKEVIMACSRKLNGR